MGKAAELAALIGSQTALSNRNLIINGAANVNQRGDSTGVTAEGYYGPDRWYYKTEGEETVSISQASDGPDGFANSYKVEVTTTDSTIAADDYARVETRFEGQDLQQLKYGTSGAESITLSFYVKSSVTGTYAVAFYSADGVRAIGSTYTISSANTWEYKTLTFAGDTGGTINDDNTEALRVWFVLSAGSNFTSSDNTSWGAYSAGKVAYGHTANVIGTSSATWQITGVQLEVGEQATPFEHRSFAQELEACRRYFVGMGAFYSDFWGQTGTQIVGVMIGAHANNAYVSFKTLNGTQMRATPTAVIKGTPKLTNFSSNQQNLTAAGITSHHTLNFTYDGSQRTALEHIAINAGDSGAGFGLDAEL